MDVNAGSPGTPNRLIHETSPYLRQHAHNPVDWYPWGDEALQAAREQDRPIFLSIGYSACHWCHVMEHESFEDPQIAELMSRLFVCIKVDREERPDLDQIYMNSVQLLTGHGGWPMSVFLTPDLKPFYGGTYWPPHARGRMPGFSDVLQKVREAWDERRDEVHRAAEQLTSAVVDSLLPHAEAHPLNESLMEIALRDLKRAADRTHGGFGRAPKFPHPMDLRLLLRLWKRLGDDDALHIVRFTLDKMARGGIYDHLGGGFHRYSTDARWLAPHFEKMLYDNALLAAAYLEAFQATGEAEFQQVARGILDYVLREMTQEAGGFFSTQDADSEGEEGRFFVWSEEEIVRELGPDDARLFNDCYDVTAAGNWEGKNILNRPKPHAEAARVLGMSEEELEEILSRCREKLFAARSRRVAPGRDDKVLVSWNGMMIAAMATGAQVLGESRYAQAAQKAADFILDNMRRDDGRLLHTYKDGQARLDAYLDDYACLIDGLAELYQATFDVRHLESAVELVEQMLTRFRDPAGGFYYTADDHETLIARSVDSQDNAVPSGNAMAATALLKLGRLCARPEWEEHAVTVLERLSGQMAKLAMASGQALLAADFVLGPSREIVIAQGSHAASSTVAERELAVRFVPNKVVLRRPHGTSDEELPEVVRTMLSGKHAEGAEPEIYLCEKGVCHTPVRGASGLAAALERVPNSQP